MDSKTFFEWLKTLPVWLRSVVLILLAALVLIASLSFSACGTPKTVATVHNVNPNSTVTVSMTVSNSNTSSPTIDTNPSLTIPNNLLDGK